MFRRDNGVFYIEDAGTGKQTGLHTNEENKAKTLLEARNAAQRQPVLTLHLGHNSKAIHRAYAKKAQITAPSLEDYEMKAATWRFLGIPACIGSRVRNTTVT